MKCTKWNIPTLIFLFVFVTGTVGINVSNICCLQCKGSYKQVQIIPSETQCPCHDCGCCHSCCTEKHSHDHEHSSEHNFYKVTDDWAETQFAFQLSDFVFTYQVVLKPVVSDTYQNQLNKDVLTYIDTSPPLEFLCIFRC